MFKRISYTIALQFTAFVFGLFLVNGAVFLAADFGNARHQTQMRLSRMMHFVIDRPGIRIIDLPRRLPPEIRERVRIVDKGGSALYSGGIFTGIPFEAREGVATTIIQSDQYSVLTAPILYEGELAGYIQVAEVERLQRGDLPYRALIYLLGSIAISLLTFLVGLFFARRSLKPAAEMVQQLEQFTQDASHELRTPLAVVGSSLDLALRNKKYEEGIASAKEDLKKISALVERLLDLARLDTFTLERRRVDLSALAMEATEKHRLLAQEKEMAIEADIAPGVTAQGDEALLGQVIGNLLSNAIKFNRPKGTIRVRLTKSALTVEDEGAGIPAQALPRIFDRFYQADDSRAKGGFGLGLSLVKRIVELHGWSAEAENRKEGGARFTIRFS